jgi:hypothetical protein
MELSRRRRQTQFPSGGYLVLILTLILQEPPMEGLKSTLVIL